MVRSDAEEIDYLEDLFWRLSDFKRLPNYQFERRVDIFLTLFLPEILAEFAVGGDSGDGMLPELVAPEFPVLKDPTGNKMSTNMDYVFVQRSGRAPPVWYFVELKTDVKTASSSSGQFDYYCEAQNRGMEQLLEELRRIRSVSEQDKRYEHLLARVDEFAELAGHPDERIEIVYLSPVEPEFVRASEAGSVITFAEIAGGGFESSEYARAWGLFAEHVLPSLVVSPDSSEGGETDGSFPDNYDERRAYLESPFPEAYRFLTGLERLQDEGVTVSSVKNAHIYSDDRFLSRIEFVKTASGWGLLFKPKRHGAGDSHADDAVDLLYPDPFRAMLQEFGGLGRWAKAGDQSGFLVYPGRERTGCEAFFEALLARIVEV